MSSAKLFVGVYLLACAAGLASALAVNVLGNAINLFPSPLVPAFSERVWKTKRLEDDVRESRPPQVIILGSSRVMQIQPDYVQAVTGKTTFNYGVSMATPIEYLPQLRYLVSIGCHPKMVLVGVDESSFRDAEKFGLIEDFGHPGLFRELPFPENVEVLTVALQRINLDTTRRSLSRLVRKRQPVVRTIKDVDYLLLANGYLICCNHLREIEKGTFDQAGSIRGLVKRLKGGNDAWPNCLLRPSPRELGKFEEFLLFCKEKGIEVRVMFLPLQPDYESQMFTPELTQARSALTRKIQTMCIQYGAVYKDFTDLASYDGDPKQFYDAVHQTPFNTRKMINVLFGLKASEIVADLPTDNEILAHLPPGTTLTTMGGASSY